MNCVTPKRSKRSANGRIFAERHQMLLVVAVEQGAVAVDDLDRIEIMRALVAGQPLGEPRGAGDQGRAAVQEIGDLQPAPEDRAPAGTGKPIPARSNG